MYTIYWPLAFASVPKWVFAWNHSCEIAFCLHVQFHADQTHFQKEIFMRTCFEIEAQGNSEMAHYAHQFEIIFPD